MIIVFLGAHHTFYRNFIHQEKAYNLQEILHLIPLAFAVFLLFFRLRLFDEIKDSETDAKHHPERPLPRGLLTKNEVLRAIYIIIPLEILLFGFYGLWALLSALVATSYSLVMYKEFFVKKWLRSHLTTYAVTHTFIVVFISITIFAALFNTFTKILLDLVSFSLTGWFLFNIFEFGRKTYALQEEKESVNSYSKIFGKFGAVLIVMLMAILSIVFIERVNVFANYRILFLWAGLLGISGLLYIALDRTYFAKLYRASTSLYVIITYATIIILQLYT